jgi:hypothetical protein
MRFDPDNPLPPSQYHCGVNDNKFFYGNAIPNIVTDIAMLMLPVPYIYTLQLRSGQKLALAGIFLVGLLYVCLIIAPPLTEQRLTETNAAASQSFPSFA